ncbi:MAG: insulinase family protein, partial [Rhodoferax sp.]|nr:insulinase family protein [Rhodoferax sp.]
PEVRFAEAIQKAIYNDHPRRPRIPKASDFDQLDLDRAMDIYRARFGSAKGLTFLFVGSLDTRPLQPLVARYLGNLPVAEVATQFRDHGLRTVKGVVRSEVLGGSEAKSILSLTLTGEATYSNSANMALRALVDVLDIKLVEVLREKMGAVYSPSLSAQFSKLPYGHYHVNLTVPSSPENVGKIADASLAEMQKLKDEGPQAGDLAKVKENWIKNFREAVKTNGYWLSVLRSSLEQGEDPARVLTYEARVKALTAADVQRAARQYLDTQNMVQMALNPIKP